MGSTDVPPPEFAEPPPRLTGWKAFFVLLAACYVGSLLLIPFSWTLVKQLPQPGVPAEYLTVVLVASFVINVFIELGFSAAAIGLGLWLGGAIGLGTPRLRAWLEGDRAALRQMLRPLPLALGLGVVVGAVVLGISLAFKGLDLLPKPPQPLQLPPAWEGFLASIGAGIREEVWLRLGLMTLLVWCGTRMTRRPQPGPVTVWTGNVLAALIFGAIHLPQGAAFYGGLTPGLVAFALLANGLGGVVFGWLYWRHGLLAAMAAHFSTDVVLKVIYVLLYPWLQ
jgi:Type II CAAX prenyl endopeptidase Rce1-like